MAKLVTGDALDSFVAAHGALPWRPGVDVDCCLALAEWAMGLGYDDPAAHLRGTYDTDDGFVAIVAAAGGVVPLVTGCLHSLPASQVVKPSRGDIGVIGSTRNIHRQFGAIHDGCGWIVRMRAGYGRMSARTIAAWRIPPKIME